MPAKAQYDKRFGHLAFRDCNRASAYCYKGGNIRKIRYFTFRCWAIGVETDATCLTCHNLQDSMNEIPVCFLAKKKCTFLLMRTFIREKYVQVKSRLSSRWQLLYWSFSRHTHKRTKKPQKEYITKISVLNKIRTRTISDINNVRYTYHFAFFIPLRIL